MNNQQATEPNPDEELNVRVKHAFLRALITLDMGEKLSTCGKRVLSIGSVPHSSLRWGQPGSSNGIAEIKLAFPCCKGSISARVFEVDGGFTFVFDTYVPPCHREQGEAPVRSLPAYPKGKLLYEPPAAESQVRPVKRPSSAPPPMPTVAIAH